MKTLNSKIFLKKCVIFILPITIIKKIALALIMKQIKVRFRF